MNYEEKYKEALEKAKNWYVDGQIDFKKSLETLFPELKESEESEDEKIRKWIINEIKIKHHNLDEENVDFVDKAIAWLEKQGEKLPVGFYYVNSEGKKFYSDTFKYGNVTLHVEKQGEQEKDILEDCIILDGNEDGLIVETIRYKNEKQDEKNPIINVLSREVILAIWDLGNEWKELTGGSISTKYDTQLKYIQKHWQESEYYLRAMQGKQKPTNKVAPKFKVGDKIYLKPEYRMPDDDTPIANTVKEIRRIDDKHYRFDGSYIFIEDQDKYELVEQKPAWSEEDINMIDWLIRCCEEEHKELCNDKYGHQDIVSDLKRDCRKKWDWLESLKNRVAPQNRWKPSETDIMILEKVFNGKIDPKDFQVTLSNVLEQLKKLKEGKV